MRERERERNEEEGVIAEFTLFGEEEGERVDDKEEFEMAEKTK